MTGSSLSGISGNKTTPNVGNDDWWALRLDAQGNILWDFNFGGIAEEGFEAGAVQTSDGNFVLAGRTRSGVGGDITSESRGVNDILVVKINGNGSGVIWQKRFGGDGEDVAFDVVETSDGSIVVGGYTTSSDIPGNPPKGSLDAYLISLEANGNVEWEKTFGGSGFESVDKLISTQSGSILAGAYSASTDLSTTNQGSFDYWLFEVNDQGTQEWENTYGGAGVDAVRSIARTSQGEILLAGQSNSNAGGDKSEDGRGQDDIWLVKTDASGNLIWEKTLGGDGFEWGQALYALSDGSFVVGGFSNSSISGDKTRESINESLDAWFVKMDNQGEVVWQGLFGGGDSEAGVNIPYYDENTDEIYISGATSSGLGQFLSTENFGSSSDLWLSKFRVNSLDSEVEACLNSNAFIDINGSVEGKQYQLRNTDGSDNGTPLVGNGGILNLISAPITEATTLDVYTLSVLSDESVLEEFVGQVQVTGDGSLDQAKISAINFKDHVCHNRRGKVWVMESVAGVLYQLVDNEGQVFGQRMGNGNKIHILTGRLRESVDLRLKLVGTTCTDFHEEDISIQVSDKIEASIVFDSDKLFTDQPIDFSTDQDDDIIKWTWKFDGRHVKRGEHVSHTFSRTGIHWVRLKVETTSGCKKYMVKRIRVREEIFVSAPGLFEPNSGNGPFKVTLKNVTHESLAIYNQHGWPIYYGRNSWNGTKRGRLVKEGVYIYYIRAKRKNGTLFVKRGSFYLKH